MREKISGILVALMFLCVFGGIIYYAKDDIAGKVRDIKSKAVLEENLAQSDEEIEESDVPFYTIESFYGDKATRFYDPEYPYELKKMGEALKEAPSKYVWADLSYLWGGQCDLYSVKKESFFSRHDYIVENYELPEGSLVDPPFDVRCSDLDVAVKETSKYLLMVFNRHYRFMTTESMIEPVDTEFYGNVWADEDWDGMDAGDFYEKYKLVTETSMPVLKNVICGEYANGFESEVPFGAWMLIYEMDVTTKSGDEHPVSWLPQAGETKKVNVIISCYNNELAFIKYAGAINTINVGVVE